MCYCTYKYSLKNMYDLGLFFSKFENKSINKLKKMLWNISIVY